MSEGSFRSRGGNSEEPEGASLPPGGGPGGASPGCGDNGAGRGDPPQDDWGEELPPADDQGQGLFWCVPAGAPDLAGFAGDGGVPAIAPGPLLAGLTATVAGGDGAGLAAASDDFVFAVIAAGRRMASWGTWLELSALRELALRHPATPARPAKGAPSGATQPGAAQPGGGSARWRVSRPRTGGCRSASSSLTKWRLG